MRVVVISRSYIPRVNREKLKKLAEKGIDLYLITPKEWKDKLKKYSLEPDIDKIKIIPKSIVLSGRLSLYFYNSLRDLQELKPDIVHIEEEPWTLSCFQAMSAAKKVGSKTIFFTWENIYKNFIPPFSLIENYNLRNADYAIAGNTDAKKVLIKKGFEKPIRVLPQLGVDPTMFKPQDSSLLKERLNLNGFVIGFVGRLVKEKGLLTLVEAVSKINYEYTLLIVGRGNLKIDIINLAKKLGIERKIKFVDTVPHSEVPKYLNCMDILVLPSITTKKWKEQFGHVLIEAMACEVPVIGSNSGEIPNVIGDSGLVFKEKDANDLAEKLSILMSDERLRKSLAKKGRGRVLNNYTWDRIANETYKIYQDLLG